MQRDILCTVGPASRDSRIIARLASLGVTLFRINLSHTALDDVAPTIKFIQSASFVPVCLDTEGAQIRTGRFVNGPVTLKANSNLRIARQRVAGDGTAFNLHPIEMVTSLEPGDFISIDFDSVLVQVIGVDADGAVVRVLNGGGVGSFKAITVQRDIAMSPLSAKDRAALVIGRELGIRHVALSFANRGSDVEEIRKIAGDDCVVISKIETRSGVERLADIARMSDAILIDRGDLSRQVPLEQIPRIQKKVIQTAKRVNRKVYVATNLLESMITSKGPTRAEVNDVYNTLLDGADGLVLAAETAIGVHPIQCTSMIARIIHEFERQQTGDSGIGLQRSGIDLLVEPHGRISQQEIRLEELSAFGELPALTLRETDLLDCEQLSVGTFAPLSGFMDRATIDTVLQKNCLPNGAAWTLPIVLQISSQKGRHIGAGSRLLLRDVAGVTRYVLEVSESEAFDAAELCLPWFGTDDRRHPGVARLLANGDWRLAGRVLRVVGATEQRAIYQLTPLESRYIFAQKGWSQVIGFHTQDVAHRAHEYLQLKALEQTAADGLYISPIVGPKNPGDFLPGPIMRTYELLLEFGIYPRENVVLGSFATYSRYCGPREAVFAALCAKNMGCSHFILGPDPAGVDGFYPSDANRRIFERLGDIGIVPIVFDEVGYSARLGRYGTAAEVGEGSTIGGSELRDHLQKNEPVPSWFMRDIIHDMLRDDIANGRAIFEEKVQKGRDSLSKARSVAGGSVKAAAARNRSNAKFRDVDCSLAPLS